MKRYCVIIGLRTGGPSLAGAEAIPSYLGTATENHRKGFQLPGSSDWFAFTPLSLDTIEFDSEHDAEQVIQEIIWVDKGWFRPLTILWLYK